MPPYVQAVSDFVNLDPKSFGPAWQPPRDEYETIERAIRYMHAQSQWDQGPAYRRFCVEQALAAIQADHDLRALAELQAGLLLVRRTR